MIAGSALGGAMLALLGVQANSYGLAVILSPMMYIYDGRQFTTYILVGLATFVFTFCCTKGTIDGRRSRSLNI